jgi:hypothetical protein
MSEQLLDVSQTLGYKTGKVTLEWGNYVKVNLVVCVLLYCR